MVENLSFTPIKDMEKFTTAELHTDLAACIEDIKVCKEALAMGINYYNEGKSRVGIRLSVNSLIKKAIEDELIERAKETLKRNRRKHGNRQI